MSNFQEQEKQYELPSDLIEEFLSVHGFVGKSINYIQGFTFLAKESERRSVKVPTMKTLNKTQIEKCLIDAELTFADLDAYIEHLKVMKRFDTIIEQSLKRPTNKK
ncbi:hypothetical protein [Bacteroides sp. GM023]|uniref:hypothetical protein n=1 Tax=Bacteroides sp. GM023 TaxID=2723058 RepID=UPI00168BD06D|nr:hypothetical protein [Bacteroides sp. GM023]MBD3588788.1 hypothetical protein [Bacteroides sp. GM023]